MKAQVHDTIATHYMGPRIHGTAPTWSWRCDGPCPSLARHRAGTYSTYYAAKAAAKRHDLLWHPENGGGDR